MALRHSSRLALGCSLAMALYVTAHPAVARQSPAPLGVDTARITIAGTSNIHAYTASTTVVRVTRVQVAGSVAGPNFWDEIVKPGGVEAFDIAIPAAKLTSPKEGLDKNMHKALKAEQHPDITFSLKRIEPGAAPGALRALGTLRIAGVDREVALVLKTVHKDSTLSVKGELPLLMTDYGIAPPKAMLGMLKTDPKVTVTFEVLLGIPLT